MLGALGKRETEAGAPDLTERERPIVRRQVVRVAVQSAVIAVAMTLIVFLLWSM